MATLLNSESRRLYSWWWDSHISPKNSKWLQENLTDMDAKVKAMIKLIEEDADSFARRAEMYYKKRPELMKLVEEFYRAYRALAERYNHATGELLHAHRKIAQAFPDQVPFPLSDDPASSSEPSTPEPPHPIHSFFDPDPAHSNSSLQGSATGRKGLKQLHDMLLSSEVGPGPGPGPSSADGRPESVLNSGGVLSHLSKENQRLKSQVLSESERARKAESEVENLRGVLADVEAKRDAIFLQFEQTLEKLSNLEKDLDHALKGSIDLDGIVSESRVEIQALNEALESMEAERDATRFQLEQSTEKLAKIESLLSRAREDSKKSTERAITAEYESQNFIQEFVKLQAEKEIAEVLYKECVEKIPALVRKLEQAEENLKLLSKKSERGECEVNTLKEEISRVEEERDSMALLYNQSLETISKLEFELSEVRADNIRLNSQILIETAKLKSAEENCDLLDKMNETLQLEAQNLVQRIANADLELSEKNAELAKLTSSLQEERSRFLQVEASLHTLQCQHFESQEQQKALTLELESGVQMMNDLEKGKQDVEVEIQLLKEENRTLNDLNSSSIISRKNLEDEILRLKAIKEKLESEVTCQSAKSVDLKLQVQNLREEIEGLYDRYRALMSQLESVGLDPECFASSIKDLREENSRLKEVSIIDREDREVLEKKLGEMEEITKKNMKLERSLLEVNAELARSKDHTEAMQESCHDLNEEKASLVSEKAALLSQLQTITQTLHNLIERNTSLNDSLSSANSELERLRAKSKGLEDFCELLGNERSNLLEERSTLVSHLKVVEDKLEKLDTRFTDIQEEYLGLEKEKQLKLSQVDELQSSFNVEKQERVCLVLKNEARLSGLEGRIDELQEENKYRKREFEEQLEKAVNAQVEIFVLQKFIQDMEDKNYSLLIECQRHVENAKYSEKLINELESENMVQELEAELLLEKITTLRKGINQVMKALEVKQGDENEGERNFVPFIISNIRNIKRSLSDSKDENQKIWLEKSVLSTILRQLHIECSELSSRKLSLEEKSRTLTRRLVMVDHEKNELLERVRELSMEVDEREKRTEALNARIEELNGKQNELCGAYVTLEKENHSAFEQNMSLEKELIKIKKEKNILEEGNDDILAETLALEFQSVILKSCGIEKACELDNVYDEICSLNKAYIDLENESRKLEENLLSKEVENMTLKASMEDLECKQHELNARNNQLRRELLDEKELVNKKDRELTEMEVKLKANEDLNSELSNTVVSLEKDYESLDFLRGVLEQQMVELSKNNTYQEIEISNLKDSNGNLESEVDKLHEEIEEYKIREVILTSELNERNSEFEIWEAEATSFYFDLQICNVRDVLFENKVHDLSSLCESLEDVSNRRSVEIERMKQRVTSLENEVHNLKSELTNCLPLIASLKDNISSLEKNPVLQSKINATTIIEKQENIEQEKGSSLSSTPISELGKLKDRIKIIEEVLEKEKEMAVIHEQSNTNIRLELILKEIEEMKTIINNHHRYEEEHRRSSRVSTSETFEVKSGAQMKDIPLDQASGKSFQRASQRGSATSDDQMLGLWEEAENNSISNDQFISEVHEEGTDIIEGQTIDRTSLDNANPESLCEKELGIDSLELSNRGTQLTKKGATNNVLERLSFDAQKLVSLQVSVEELKRKLDPKKRRKKGEEVEYDSFRGKLLGVENSIVQLTGINGELTKSIERNSMTSDMWVDRVRKEGEKISKLEEEIETMKYVSLKIKDDKKSKGKEESSRSSASFVLREFFYNRVRKSKKPKKSRFCGCIGSKATATKN